MIVRLFDFNKDKWKPIYKKRNIWTKFILISPACKFRRVMKNIVAYILKINEFNRRNHSKPIIKATPKIVII